MVKPFLLVFAYILKIGYTDNVTLMSKSRSAYLDKYRGYSDAIVMHFNVPEDVSFVSIKFVADETKLSIFACKPKDLTLYLKYGAPPVINPDGSKFPPKFYFTGRPDSQKITFKSDKKPSYINITTPHPGNYYAAVFETYTDPKDEAITQDGLTPECYTYLDAAVYNRSPKKIQIVTEGIETKRDVIANEAAFYKFYIGPKIDHAKLTIKNIKFCESCQKLIVRGQGGALPSEKGYIFERTIEKTSAGGTIDVNFFVDELRWYYLGFKVESLENTSESLSFTFILSSYSYVDVATQNVSLRLHRDVQKFDLGATYRFYELYREQTTESFKYSFELPHESNGEAPVGINLTSSDFAVLKFKLEQYIDSGGTLQFIAAFKPRIKELGNDLILEKEPQDNFIVGCIQNIDKMVPLYPNKCVFNNIEYNSTIILNNTQSNMSVQIPFPESRDWYVSLKLFCGKCEPCRCPETCRNAFQKCLENCEKTCVQPCTNCYSKCVNSTLKSGDCLDNCNCYGDCDLNRAKSCNSTVIFDISSYTCVPHSCGKNGKCTFTITEGFVYTTCICTNNYRGWDCSDDSQANSYLMIVLELLLLVLSNLAFLPAVFFAYRRKYYVEMIIYSFTCFFSTFYHACDAGENIISFCMFRLNVLQFSDFYCGLLSIWVTLIAMANIPIQIFVHIFHIVGAILLAFGTTYNKTSLWVFLLPALIGVSIILISWYLKYRNLRRLFLNKRYLIYNLPIGVITVSVGLICYSLLQTRSNYKYLHSLWHILMAVGIIILLPNDDTFKVSPTDYQ